MAVVVVGGSGRGVGKTALVCGLLAALPELRWIAVKITSHEHPGLPPVYEETVPGQGTDTSRYRAAGAVRAFLLTAPEQPNARDPDLLLVAVLDAFWPRLDGGANLIFESNRILHHLRPDLCLLVRGRDQGEYKPSFHRAARYADAMVSLGDADQVVEDVLNVPGQVPKPVFHLAALERVSAPMREWVRNRLNLRA